MLSHYIDIHLRPDPEFPANHLMAALYAKLHRVLVQVHACTLAVSFPGYGVSPITLGASLRLLGPATDLARLMEHRWLQGMHDHVTVGAMGVVPELAPARSLRRVQAKSGVERQRRRQMRRHGLSHEQACERLPDGCSERLNLPYLNLLSASSGQRFRLFLQLGPCVGATPAGEFNSYGLSTQATIPWF